VSGPAPTADEIDDLLAEVAAPRPQAAAVRPKEAGPQPFDFRRPNKFSRDHVRALQIVNETFARQFGTILSTTLRAVSTVVLAGVEQMTYDEYVQATPNPSMLAILSLEPLNGAALFHVPLPLANAGIDRLLGGSGNPTGTWPSRPLTEIEATLMRGILDRALSELSYAFESLVELEPAVVQLESNPQFAQIAAPSDMVVVAGYETRIGGESGLMTLCIPFSSLQPVLERAASTSVFIDRPVGDPVAVQTAVTHRIEEVPVEVAVRFRPITLRSGEIVNLREGDVVPLGHRVDVPLTVMAAGVDAFLATPGKKGKRLAVQIVENPRNEP
jgi:flagellar motor switch protein FliM